MLMIKYIDLMPVREKGVHAQHARNENCGRC